MFKNYFILNRIIIEFNEELTGFTISQIFSQEKDRLIFQCTNGTDEKFLEISVNPGFPFISLKKNFNRAKKNTLDFFQDYLPAKILSFEIAKFDRVIRLNLSNASLYFIIRGKYTNVYLIDDKRNSLPFEKSSDEEQNNFLKETSSLDFIDYFNLLDFSEIDSNEPFNMIRKNFPILGKEIINEANIRLINSGNNNSSILTEIINEIKTSDVNVFINRNNLDIVLLFDSFYINESYREKTKFNSAIEAVNYYFHKKYYYDELLKKKKLIDKALTRDLSRLSNKLNGLKIYMDRGDREKEYQLAGNLLLINLNEIHGTAKEVELKNIYDNDNKIKIKLNETLSVQRNAEEYFKKAKNEKTVFKKSQELYSISVKRYNALKEMKEKADKLEDIKEANEIMKELKIQSNEEHNVGNEIKIKFKHYIIDGKYDVYVGKDSQNNDLLTTKFAKPNDYWFHARSVPGSHVVLRVTKLKEQIPKLVLKKIASLAAFHSKAKTAGTVPVSFTQKKYVIKKKGMGPGKVALLREDTLLVKPEIPIGSEYVVDE